MRQRVAFALEQIFVISDRLTSVKTRAYGQSKFYDMLAAAADQPASGSNGSYRKLLEDVSKSPMMGKYLSHLQNQKAVEDPPGSGNIILSPDENYAREIMQLFSIGLLQLHPDGLLKLGGNGLPIQTYTNDDIKALARVFTGWSFSWRNGGAPNYSPATIAPTDLGNNGFYDKGGYEYFHAGYENPMQNFPALHDEAAKTVLGTGLRAINGGEDESIYAQGDLSRALDVIFNHVNTAPFISRLLIQRLVTSNPSRGYIYRVEQVFENNGSGARGDLKAVVNAILTDYEARSLTLVDPNSTDSKVDIGYGKVKEPIIRYVQALRAFGAKSSLPVSDLTSYGYSASQQSHLGASPTRYRFGDTMPNLAQTPQDAPSVFNWYLPDYSPGGKISGAGLAAPELQIMTENLVVSAVNYHRQIEYVSVIVSPPPNPLPIGQNVTALIGADPLLDNIVADIYTFVDYFNTQKTAHGGDARAAMADVVDRLDSLLTAGALKVRYGAADAVGALNTRSIIIDQASAVSANNRIRAAIYLITSSPEYITQK